MPLKAPIFFSLGSLFLIFGNDSLKAGCKGQSGRNSNPKGIKYTSFFFKLTRQLGKIMIRAREAYSRKVIPL